VLVAHQVNEGSVMTHAGRAKGQVLVHIIIAFQLGGPSDEGAVVVFGAECYSGLVVVAFEVGQVDEVIGLCV